MVGAGDMFLWSLLGHHGRGKYLPGVLPSVYRIHKDGIHSGVSRAKQYLMRLQTYYALHVFYQRLGSQDLANYFLGQLALDGKNVLLQAGQTKGIQMLYELPNVIAEQVGGDFDIPTRALSEVLYRVIKDNSNL
jgi:hypothetical protein